jgi:hypothetical protein
VNDPPRPRGKLDGKNMVKNNVVEFTIPKDETTHTVAYASSEVSGIEKIKYRIKPKDDQDDKPWNDGVQMTVRVPNLFPLSGGNFTLIGQMANHGTNHYGTIFTITSMYYLAEKYYETTGNELAINDISLKWGGVYDLCGKWNASETCTAYPDGGHKTHRKGTDVDVHSKSMTDEEKEQFKKLVCNYHGYPLLHGSSVHWHLFFAPYNQRNIELCQFKTEGL